MKILVVSNMYPSAKDPSYGTFVRNFYEDLVRRNGEADTSLVTIKGRRYSKAAKLQTYISFYSRLLSRLILGRYDLIYVHTVTFPTPALRVAALFRKLPLVFNVHGDDVLPSNRFKALLRNMSKPLMRKARMIVSPSDYFRKVVCDIFGPELDSKITVSPSGGINAMFLKKKSALNTGDTPMTLGFVSRIEPGKGWDTYIQAIKALVDEGIDCQGIVAGSGSQATELTGTIKRLRLNDRITIAGSLSQEELAALYQKFDLFIFPSTLQESLGLVGLEAMGAGVPVIASAMAGPTSYITPGRNGYLFTPGDVNDLVAKIKQYQALSSDEKRKMSDCAYNDALNYESSSVSEQLFNQIHAISH